MFSLNADGELAFRSTGQDAYISQELDDETAEEVEAAADVCPMQAIRLEP
jgi:ferredoxin